MRQVLTLLLLELLFLFFFFFSWLDINSYPLNYTIYYILITIKIMNYSFFFFFFLQKGNYILKKEKKEKKEKKRKANLRGVNWHDLP